MAKVVSNDFVRLYSEDSIELALDDGTYAQVFYTAEFSNVTLFGVAYKVVERVDFSHVVTLDERGEVTNNHNMSDCGYYKKVAFDIISNKIDSYDYQHMYKTFSKDYINDVIANQ